jgi:hypothetical protein
MNRTRLAALPLLLVLGACVTAPEDGSTRVQTTSQANRESLKGAAEAPLRDFNLLRTKIPDVLLAAMADPYERPPKKAKCADLVNLIAPLDEALGADLDVPPSNNDALERGRLVEQGRGAAYGALSGVATDAIPFRGWVRKLTGAERHDKFVQAAINAGAVRRAYLKGLGEAKGCNPPATPSHALAGAPVMTQDFRPRYPTKLPAQDFAGGRENPGGTPPAAPPK